jgi:hypothetical protein
VFSNNRIMYYSKFLAVLATCVVTVVASCSVKRTLPLPLSSSDRWIIDANGKRLPYVGVNWPGAADTMLPEGLQYSSIACIVYKIRETGFNAVRLTFAIEMVDDILDNGGDVPLEKALTKALGQRNGTAVLERIMGNNPQFTPNTTRLQVRAHFSSPSSKVRDEYNRVVICPPCSPSHLRSPLYITPR